MPVWRAHHLVAQVRVGALYGAVLSDTCRGHGSPPGKALRRRRHVPAVMTPLPLPCQHPTAQMRSTRLNHRPGVIVPVVADCVRLRVGRGFDVLGVDADRGRVLLMSAGSSLSAAQQVVDALGRAVVAPGSEVPVHRLARREVFPHASRPIDIQDRVHDLPQAVHRLIRADLARQPGSSPCDQFRFDLCLLGIRQITTARLTSTHTPSSAHFKAHHSRFGTTPAERATARLQSAPRPT